MPFEKESGILTTWRQLSSSL